MSMVEKVARALMLNANEGKTDEGWPMMEDYARVAIAAMREPTPEMLRAIEMEFSWSGMIDAALMP